jgi:hypothetical protein
VAIATVAIVIAIEVHDATVVIGPIDRTAIVVIVPRAPTVPTVRIAPTEIAASA